MAKFMFPLFQINEIVESFKLWDIAVSEKDFEHPKKEVWQEIFLSLLARCLDKEESDLVTQFQCQFNVGLESVTHPRLHEDSLLLFTLSRVLCRVLQTCKIEDFSIRDIIEPKRNKLVKICSGLMNFINFRTDRMNAYYQIKEEDDSRKEQRDILNKEIDHVQRKINTIRSSRAEQEPQIKTVNENIEVLTLQMDHLRSETTGLQKQIVDAKAKIAEKRAYCSKTKEAIAIVREEGVKLSSQIVLSPERMKSETQKMQAQKQNLITSKEDKQYKVADLQRKIHSMEQYVNDCTQVIDLINSIQEMANEEKDKNLDIQKTHQQTSQRREQLKEATTKEQQLGRILNKTKEKVAKLNLQHNSRITALKEELEILDADKQKVLSQQTEEEFEVHKIQEAINQQELLESQMQKEHDDMMMVLKSKYQTLLDQVDLYHKNLGEAWEKVSEKMGLSFSK